MLAKLKIPTTCSSSSGGATAFPHGVEAKQDCPPSHSALVPDGQGLASSQFATSSPHDKPQKNLDVTSSTSVSVSDAKLPEIPSSLSPIRGVQIVGEGELSGPGGLPPVGFPGDD